MLQLCHYDVTKSLLFLIIFFFQSGKASNLACFSACSFIFSSSMARCFALGNKETVNIRINKKGNLRCIQQQQQIFILFLISIVHSRSAPPILTVSIFVKRISHFTFLLLSSLIYFSSTQEH